MLWFWLFMNENTAFIWNVTSNYLISSYEIALFMIELYLYIWDGFFCSSTQCLGRFTFANIANLRICPTLLLKVCLFSRANFYLVSEQIHVTPLVRLWPSLLWPDLPLRWRASPLFVRSRNANTAQLLPTGCPTNWITTPLNAEWPEAIQLSRVTQRCDCHLFAMLLGMQATSRVKVPQLMSYVFFVNFGTHSHKLGL